ncbi:MULTISPECIES: helix-turn-helix domain-containing protein [Rossellomorea]|jgi:DNA-binding HxlR family transcriptional regulator|uniref:Helix-turn-helix transcriptional regulator n=1 Tax=Rossellomorea aquimaris TaxID=189382 RepID=A0A5D4UQM4_9BACI|nr:MULTISPECIES: helix-turn-helix domain-containing protein [Rossellomorea]MDT9027099.1 helix-turn-helix domain-containing protein [Rossellomorea sp. YC4-1]TYS82083.1 helix-turn-helix transcriptional regulator [Rossellomorea aquimaris]TYS88706.1 helix-turn-helix transcriptional regulator [Rossellomorea aquimaris]TYS89604.1 helix-turn-helix transcriptional regulator [Rossellomorea aquimaris]
MDTPIDQEGKLKCSIEYTLKKIGGKWKTVILWHLGTDGTLRYNELRRLLPGVAHKVLSQQLKELEEDGFINRTQYDTIPPKVEYSMTELGMTLMPILKQMHVWGKEHGEF